MKTPYTTLLLATLLTSFAAIAQDDPHQWLEEVESPRALAWVAERNARTTQELEATEAYRPIFERALKILDSTDRIPLIAFHREHVYNFWQDARHERGIWRRTTLSSYRSANPNWETVLDVDALGRAEGKPWVFKGANCLEPAYRFCLISLSRGGGDAVEVREFDVESRSFVGNGFKLPEAKSRVGWFDADTIWVSTDFGPGSMTRSGYPRLVKLWKRGTPLDQAATVFSGKEADMVAAGTTLLDLSEGRQHHLVTRTLAFYKEEYFLRLDGRLVKLGLPEDAKLQGIFKDRLLVSLRSDWVVGDKTYRQGALVSIGLNEFLQGSRAFETLFEPSPRTSLASVVSTRNCLVLLTLDNVRSRLQSLVPGEQGWIRREFPLPGLGHAALASVDRYNDLITYTYADFLTPTALYLDDGLSSARLKALPAYFSTEGMRVDQFEARSKDGTSIPYFVVQPKGFRFDGKAPTLLYGYGGFEVPQLPRYNAVNGAAWMERGGVYVLANIRGGGEFGPSWHQAALKHNRIKVYEDFIAVAEDLLARKITRREHLGIMGGSQGGLLVGGAFALRPDLFKAAVAAVPLADMKRYHKLLAGASWMAEYGDPDQPGDWVSISRYSPYQLLKKDAKYPTAFFWTTTRDDRVHPGHARKMVARMEELGHPVYYFENTEGGHGSGTTNKQSAHVAALYFAYLWAMLKPQ